MNARPRRTVLFAGVASVAGLAGAYAAAGWTERFIVLPIDGLIIELTPAPVVNYMIENVGESAHYLHVLGAFAVAGVLLAGSAAAGLVLADRSGGGPAGVAVSTALAGGVVLAVSGAALPAVTAAAAVGAVVALGSVDVDLDGGAARTADDRRGPAESDGDRRKPAEPTADRRAAVGAIAGTVAYGGISLALGSRVTERAYDVSEELGGDRDRVRTMLDEAASRDLGVAGVPGPVSSIDEFYTVDINSAPPLVEAGDWTLTIRGAVERTVTVDYDALREDLETEHRYVALRCIGEDLNDRLMHTALWTGTPLTPLLEEAGVEGDYVELHSADGYVSTFSRAFLDDGMIAYGMNGEVLPREHGYPARALLPGSWGKFNNKWITDVVFVEEPTVGYWEDRGWEGEAPITAVAKIWTGDGNDPVNRLSDGRLEVGGHAYAGLRGVDRVEVSVDGGETWDDAELAEPLPGVDVTRQWRYRYEADASHEVVARTIDGDGNVQPREETGSFPAGASGWVSATVEP